MVDSLWLVDINIFQPWSADNMIIRTIIRKIFKISISNKHLAIDDWKEFAEWIWFDKIKSSKEVPSVMRAGNIFRSLSNLTFLKLFEPFDKKQVARLGDLISNRQMPYGGQTVEDRSWKEFKDLIGQDPAWIHLMTDEFKRASQIVGRKARFFHKGGHTSLTEALHFSVNNSGELRNPSEKGGNGVAVMNSMSAYLNEVPVENEYVQLYDLRGMTSAGKPRWMTLFRSEEVDDTIQFLDERNQIKGQPGSFWGLDEIFGLQTFHRARELMMADPLPNCRAECVCENANKARWITVTPWYLQVMQAPAGHLWTNSLSFIPECYSSFHKMDQCWEAIKLLSQRDHNPSMLETLSSDLKNATNALIQMLMRFMMTNYNEGFGFEGQILCYLDEVIQTIGPRLLINRKAYDCVIARRGIFMAEPISKGILTVYCLTMEMMSYIRYIETPSWDVNFRRIRSDYHQGGDDHLANGPKRYLRQITKNHSFYGSLISWSKHARSRIAVRYTEKIIFVHNLQNNVTFKDLDKDGYYCQTIVVDSIKVRLLECGVAAMLGRDEKNVAVGKAQQLMRSMRYLREENDFPPWRTWAIRALFISRMGSYLPNRNAHPKLYHLVFLPSEWGGYDLGFDDELPWIMEQVPWPTREVLKAVIKYREKGILNGFKYLVALWARTMRLTNVNSSTRGVPDFERFKMKQLCKFRENPQMYNGISFDEMLELYPAEDKRKSIFLAKNDGYLSGTDLIDKAIRGNLFQEILMGNNKGGFNTTPIAKTYSTVWEVLTESLIETPPFPLNVTGREIRDIGMRLVSDSYFPTSQEVCFDFGILLEEPDSESEDIEELEQTYDIRELKLLDGWNQNRPSLKIPAHVFGQIRTREGGLRQDPSLQ
jgi:hypothetical protein